ncbi:SapC family protein [Nitrincola alkalilacustris]|uniref:SapC family protein n=1 Tax=Nitrincola alkalilacustris TaxID=1571224 RepID=UPI00124C10B4|nr:SapC family protein [Nitrincola alkalilacustris]
MYKKPVPLNATQHGELKLTETDDWRFASAEMVVPIVYSEIADVAREYPLVFLKGKHLPFALLGVEQGRNAYVDDTGRWLSTYIPAKIRAYPLTLSPIPDNPHEFVIGIDSSAPQLHKNTGYRLFEAGQPSVYLNTRMEQLKKTRAAEQVTARLVTVIADAGVLIERFINVNQPGQEGTSLGGMLVVSEEKLNNLTHEDFAKLRDQGALPLIYAHLLSMANLRQGAIAGKYPQLAQQTQELWSEMLANDTIRFN